MSISTGPRSGPWALAEVRGGSGLAFTDAPCRLAGRDRGSEAYAWRLPNAPRHAPAVATTRAVLVGAQDRDREVLGVQRATGRALGKRHFARPKRTKASKGAPADA